MVIIFFLLFFFAGKGNLLRVCNNYVIARIQIRRVVAFIFAHQNLGNVYRKPPKNFFFGVYQMPTSVNVCSFYVFHDFLDFADFDTDLRGFDLSFFVTFDFFAFAAFATFEPFVTFDTFDLVLSHSKSSNLAIWALSPRLVICFTILRYPPCLSEKPGAISPTNFLKATGLKTEASLRYAKSLSFLAEVISFST